MLLKISFNYPVSRPVIYQTSQEALMNRLVLSSVVASGEIANEQKTKRASSRRQPIYMINAQILGKPKNSTVTQPTLHIPDVPSPQLGQK
jgi:hypothetical protein